MFAEKEITIAQYIHIETNFKHLILAFFTYKFDCCINVKCIIFLQTYVCIWMSENRNETFPW